MSETITGKCLSCGIEVKPELNRWVQCSNCKDFIRLEENSRGNYTLIQGKQMGDVIRRGKQQQIYIRESQTDRVIDQIVREATPNDNSLDRLSLTKLLLAKYKEREKLQAVIRALEETQQTPAEREKLISSRKSLATLEEWIDSLERRVDPQKPVPANESENQNSGGSWAVGVVIFIIIIIVIAVIIAK